LLARYPVRPVSVDQLYQSIVQATGHRGEDDPNAPVPPPMPMPMPPEADEDEPDTPVDLLGERGETLQRTLALMHGEHLHRATQAGAKVAVTVNGARVGPGHVEWLFLATLSRRPTPEEAQAMLKLAQAGKGRRGLEDVLWVLINSAEFNTNH